jgi:tetratricopeptide (TPR) repeat protein
VPPLAEGVKLASLGYQNLIADTYWLRDIQYRAACDERDEYPADLYAMGNFITDLDPRYQLVYFFTGLNLLFEGGPKDQVISILEKGEKNRPDYWRTPFLLGFYYFMVLGDYEDAAVHLEKTAEITKNKFHSLLAARVRAMGGDPETAIAFLEEMRKQTQDPNSIEQFDRRIRQLQAREMEQKLSALVVRYHSLRGVYPQRLTDLAAAGLLLKVPPHPVAGHVFVYDAEKKEVGSDPPLGLAVHNYWKIRHRRPNWANPGEGE